MPPGGTGAPPKTPTSHAPDELAQQAGLFSLLAFLMAAATLWHQAQLGDWQILSHHMALSLAALGVLLRPSSVPRFLALGGLQLVAFALDLPRVVNHWMLLAISNLTILVGVAIDASAGRNPLGSRPAFYQIVAPALRLHLVLAYGFAAIAKLNSGFLAPDLSCAASMYRVLVREYPVLPAGAWTADVAIWGTLLIELALPLMLALRRTRLAALFLGGAFHAMLSVAGHVPFSGFAFALYAAFLPDDFPSRLELCAARYPWLAAWRQRLAGWAGSRAAPLLLAGGLLLTAAAVRGRIVPPRFDAILDRLFQVSFLAYAALLLLILFLAVREGSALEYRPGVFRLRPAAAALGPVLVVLNALCPYLGLKTQSSFAMYSNLRTEGEQWNHLFMPQALKVFGLQDDLVRIEASSDPVLQASAERRGRWVYLEFRRHVSQRPEISVRYERAGQRHDVPRVADDSRLSQPPPWWARKLLWFREVLPPEANTCQH